MNPDIPLLLRDYIRAWPSFLPQDHPWTITGNALPIITNLLATLDRDLYTIRDGIAVHRTARIEEHVVLKAPVIVGADTFIGAHAYLRGGVWLDQRVSIGPGCEVKSSFIMTGSALAHFNFVGDSLVGADVNLEAGAITANHFNERTDKMIHVRIGTERYATGVTKFGALIGDATRLGANAVLSPGTLLLPQTIVKRLELIDQHQ